MEIIWANSVQDINTFAVICGCF